MDKPPRRPLAFDYDQSIMVWAVPLMIMMALTCNVTALTLPFLEIRIWPAGVENYSVPHTVELMWGTFKLYLIAVLIAGFSLVFPFVKLLMLGCAWYVPLTGKSRSRLLSTLGALGRWSLLDVFVALVLIVLAHDQGTLFVTGVEPGLGLFLCAIVMAMATGDLMHHLHERSEGSVVEVRKGERVSPLLVWAVPILAIGAIAALVAALQAPYLRITAWFLDDAEYSILGTIVALLQEGEIVFGLAVGTFLVVTPSLRIVLIAAAWWWRGNPRRLVAVSKGLNVMERWAMLDVFGLAIGLFLLEGGNLVPVERRGGVWLLVAAVAGTVVLAKVAGLLINRSAIEFSPEEQAPISP
ncbi:MAG: paraquat-inducible protein A [Phycisphaera sp.]|nr:paraquat-inducible protein A [Phycisphaera sp.]